jgi:Cu+-exporting ATPase
MNEPQPAEVLDPVCNMTISPADAVGTAVHRGQTYYFCAESCLEQFTADPERFLDPKRREAELAAQPADVEYTCPMHPEVRQIGPGTCPKCGMALEPAVETGVDLGNPELDDMSRRLRASAVLVAPIVAVMIADMIPGQPLMHALGHRTVAWAQLLLATPIVLWGGAPFFERGWASIVNRYPNMFTLIALGVGAAYLYSLAATITPGVFPPSFRESGEIAVYFEAAAVIVVLVLLGQVLELRARSRTSSAIRALLNLTPPTAHRISAEIEADVKVEDVEVGDLLRIRPGEHVPVDGTVVDGSTSVDESMVTGEAIPVEKGLGAKVTGGTINGTGSFVMRAERVGNDTLLARIVRLVGEAQRSRAPIQRLADVVAGWFVPAVVTVAAATFVLWSTLGPEPRFAHALVNSVAVLIIACPCALGLATPMSIMVGTGRGAELGVLLRDAEALEILERVPTLVVDKTGTLTEGKPRLVTVAAASGSGIKEDDLLRLAASLERVSEHPLAAAIVAGAHERGVVTTRVERFESVTGQGVRGVVDGHRVSVGNMRHVGGPEGPHYDDPGGPEGPHHSNVRAEALRKEGQTVVFVSVDDRMAGLLGIADPIKATTKDAIDALHKDGVQVVMLTGDNRATADVVARALSIDRVEAEVLPDRKADVVRDLQRGGRRVAMAGDGINDAPALAQADVGIAMGTGTDIAMESAGVTLVKGDLRGIVRARRLSRATMRNIRQNLFFAFVYNSLGVPIAAGVLYPVAGILLSPVLASAAMTFSSVSVIANALRLRRTPL